MGPSWYIADDRVTGGSTWKAAVKKKVKKLVRSALKHLDIGITSYSKLKELEVIRDSKVSESADIDLLLSLPDPSQLLPLIRRSKSQLRQDLFVLSVLNFKRAGFFVEFGATDGITLSNTYLLEKEFGWRGILAEPARCWHKDLRSNRSAIIENRCVWRDSNSVLSFNEAEASELSTINSYTDADSRADARRKGERYDVRTISLTDLLDQNKAPRRIDYLSIDTEGSEFEILNAFDFRKYEFAVITCEHNFTRAREKIFDLRSSHGYVRKHQELSKIDDWYVRDERSGHYNSA